MAKKTKLGLEGYAVHRAGSFASKTAAPVNTTTNQLVHLHGGFGRHSMKDKGYSQ